MKRVVFEIHFISEMLSMRGHNVYAIDYESLWERGGLISKEQELRMARSYKESTATLIRPSFIKIPVLSRISATVSHYYAIKEAIQKYKIDIIILYSVPTNGLQTLYLAKKFNIPVIFRSIDILNQLTPKILSGITKALEKKVYSKVELVLTLNENLSNYVKKLGAKKVEVLPLGVDAKVFHPNINSSNEKARWLIKDTDKVILFVGTLYKFSGLDNLIEAFPKVLRQIPNAKLLIVGNGEQRGKLDKLIAGYKLWDKVIITGYEPYDLMPNYINMATVCVNPTVSCEATNKIFPTKVLQYMACGKPVIATKLDGLKDMIGIGNGVCYVDDTIENKITTLLVKQELIDFIGQRALKYVRENHSYDNLMLDLENILRRVKSEHSIN